jgi:methionyl-tRNA synthetase
MSTPSPTPSPTPPQPAPSAAPATGEPKPQITFDEFAKVDLRVARILSCEPHPSADRLWKLQLDDGSGTPRQICAGIRAYYTPDQLVGRHIVIVANLAPRVIRGEESRGMLLAASSAPKDAAGADRQVVILMPASDIAPGSIVS